MSATDSFTAHRAEPMALPTHRIAAVMPPLPVLMVASLGLLLSVCAMLAGADLGSVLAVAQ
jgi:hypothetical protein